MSIHVHSLLIMLWAISAARGAPTTQPGGHEEDVIYGRKDGMALTMDVIYPPKNANGIGIVFVVSGGWFSAHNFTPATLHPFSGVLLDRGYTIFAVVHGSQPRYTIPDAVLDLRRSVRFIRVNAKRFHI